jgi:hypothetical protein
MPGQRLRHDAAAGIPQTNKRHPLCHNQYRFEFFAFGFLVE